MNNIIKVLLIVLISFGYLNLSANYSEEKFNDGYSEPIYNKIDFKALYKDNKVYMKWSKFDLASKSDQFKYYKIIKSKKNTAPLYPDDGYIKYYSNVDDLEYIDKNPLIGTSYYRVCAITELKNRYCSNVVKIYKTADTIKPIEPVYCTMEAKLCSDGKTYVGRSGPSCEFVACPIINKPNFNLSEKLQRRVESIISNFIKKIEKKYSNEEKRILIFKKVIKRLEFLKESKPRYKNIIKYMIYLLDEKIKSYNNDFGDFEDIFSDY